MFTITDTSWRGVVLCVALLIRGSVGPALAQEGPVRTGTVSINLGVQTASAFSATVPFTVNVEQGTLTADYEGGQLPGVDASIGMRVWKNLAIGGGVSAFRGGSFSGKGITSRVSARIPHPIHYDRLRDVSGSGEGLAKTEIGLHLQAMWITSIRERLLVTVFAGPTAFAVERDIIIGVEAQETYPYDSAEFKEVSSQRVSDSAVGFNVGLDLGFYFSQHVGVGGLLRFSRGTVHLDVPEGEALSVETGGVQSTAGLRIRF